MSASDDWFIHRHLATTMDARLALLRQTPARIVLAGADADISAALLQARYPAAQLSEYDARRDYLAAAAHARRQRQGLWQRLRRPQLPQYPQHRLPEDAAADMLWANLSLIVQPDPVAVLENWAGALKPDGLLFLTHFGPDTARSLCAHWQQCGIRTAAAAPPDMHDLGDMLYHHGFYDPVMDMEKISLHYASPQGLLQDVMRSGLWQYLQPDDTAAAEAALAEGWQQGVLRTLELELVYGHALKKPRLPENTAPVHFYPHRRPTP